jgi:hypothetical protein
LWPTVSMLAGRPAVGVAVAPRRACVKRPGVRRVDGFLLGAVHPSKSSNSSSRRASTPRSAANLPAKAKGSFCGQKLIVPSEFIAQNGAELHQNTQITVTGCPKPKTRAQLYAAALRACDKQRNKIRRRACEKAARRAYGARVSRKPHKTHR